MFQLYFFDCCYDFDMKCPLLRFKSWGLSSLAGRRPGNLRSQSPDWRKCALEEPVLPLGLCSVLMGSRDVEINLAEERMGQRMKGIGFCDS